MVFFMALILAVLAWLGVWYADHLMKLDDAEQRGRKHHTKYRPRHPTKRR